MHVIYSCPVVSPCTARYNVQRQRACLCTTADLINFSKEGMKNDYISNYLSDRSAARVAANPEWCRVNEGCKKELGGVEVQILHSPSTLPPVLTWCIAVWDQGTQQGGKEKVKGL